MRTHSVPDACLRPSARRRGGAAVARLARRTLVTFGMALALVTSTAVSARAEDDATIAMARERFKEGVQFFDQKLYDKARAAFLQAYALKRHPAVLLNLAQSELRSDHEADAAKHFSQYLREHKDANEAERQAAEAGLAAAKARVAEVMVTADEEGATITVDGTTEGQSPLLGPLFINPGAHTITARKEGREATSQVTLTAGQTASTTLRLRKSAAVPPPPPGERYEREDAPKEPESRPVARHDAAATGTMEADGGADTRAREPFFKWAAHSPVAWVGGGVTVLGIAGGIGFAIASRQNYADADTIAKLIRREWQVRMPGQSSKSICNPPRDGFEKACRLYVETVDDGDNLKTAAWVSVGIGALAASGTIAYYFLSSTSRQEARKAPSIRVAHISPWLTPDAQGISLGGAF